MNYKVLLLGLATLFIFGLGGFFLIEQLQGKNFLFVLLRGWDLHIQLLTGIGYGLLSANFAWFIITRKFFAQKRIFYENLLTKLNLNNTAIIFISLCAGIGEEIFFRAGIQAFIGVWLTSLIFVGLHGYLNPFSWKISIYGTAMVFIIAGMGYLFKFAGLITAMAAHTVFDIVLLKKLQNKRTS